MINWLKSIFFIKPKVKAGHETELCFTASGIDYYKFVNEFNIPYSRAMAAMDIYRELEEKTDSKYHKLSYQTIIEMANQGNLVGIGIIASNALERMDNISNVDIMYKLASVLYFDADENPYTYDPEYADKKIKLWRKENIEDFFLRTPLNDLLPCFDGSQMNISTYTRAQRRLLIANLKNHLSMLSGKSKNKEMITTLGSQIKELEELVMSN